MSKVQKEKQIQHYTQMLAKMIDDSDIARWLGEEGRQKIVKYSALKNYKTINDLLPEPTDYRIILTESKPNCGHWTCILKYKNIIEWFDSYGVKPDGEFRYVPRFARVLLGQEGNTLTHLLKKTKLPGQSVYYNKRRLQSGKDGINTCGRWCIARILSMLVGYELDDFIEKVDAKVEETGKPPDILACDWII